VECIELVEFQRLHKVRVIFRAALQYADNLNRALHGVRVGTACGIGAPGLVYADEHRENINHHSPIN
jgi:hypothetical protein